MKQLLLASTVLALSGPAFAADLPVRMPVKAPVAAIANYSWTGCYIGGHVGAGWGRSDISEPTEPISQRFAPANTPISIDPGTGILGGAQVGCDYQFASNWVIGAAGDFSWTGINGQANDPFFAGKSGGPITLGAKTEWLATATARIGYAWDRWMLYGKGGAAWAHNNYTITNLFFWGNPVTNTCQGPAVPCNPSGSDTRVGWTLGVGLAWAFTNSWSAGIEYDHYDFGTHSVTLTDPNGAFVPISPVSGPISVKQQIDTVRLSLNYHF